MPRLPMSDEEAMSLLQECELIRVAFRDGASTYLIPLGCVWCDGALYGVADQGRKTRIAAEHPLVAFQADTARRTGLFEWASVTGHGEFEVVADAEEAGRAMTALQPFVDAAPDWWKAEQGPRMAAGELVVWRLRPKTMSGVRYARGAGGAA